MKKQFYVFRHGQTDLNMMNIWQGAQINVPLNQTGKNQAENLGLKLQQLDLETILTSPLTRARQTADIVNKYIGTTIYEDRNLVEISFGEVEGLTFYAVEKKYPELMRAVLYPRPNTWDTKFPGSPSESKHEVFERVSQCLIGVALSSPFDRFGVSTHGGVMSSLLAGLKSYGLDLPNCCVAHIEFDTLTKELSFVNML